MNITQLNIYDDAASPEMKQDIIKLTEITYIDNNTAVLYLCYILGYIMWMKRGQIEVFHLLHRPSLSCSFLP